MIDIITCPVCASKSLTPVFSAVDHTVSKKEFQLLHCEGCGFKLTSPRPADEVLGEYYKSEDYVSHSATQKGFINSIYHRVRRHTLKQKVRLVRSLNQSESVLDFGCGTGAFLKQCADSGMNVRGAEPDPDARENIDKDILNLVSEPEVILQEEERYDTITLWHVLEHVSKLNETISTLRSKMKPNGRLIIAVPNQESTDADIYGPDWAAWDVPRHLWHFSPDSIALLMLKHDLQLEETKPMWFDSVYVSMLSEKNKGGSILKAVLIGLYSNFKAFFSSKPICSSQIYIFSPFEA